MNLYSNFNFTIMNKMKLFLVALASLFFATFASAQVTEVFTAGTGANYENSVSKVDWNWARMWVESNTTNGKVTNGINVFSVANMVSQQINSATFSVYFEKIATGSLPATVEVYYKTPYTGYKFENVNYPEGCTVVGSIDITEAGKDYTLSNDALKTFVQAQVDAGEDAVLFMRTATTDVKLSFYGNLGFPTLTLDVPAAVTYAPSAKISNISGVAKDFFGMTTKDTLAVEFSKPMDVASVESKLAIEPAPASKEMIWQADTTVLIVCDGLAENTDMVLTVDAGAVAVDGTASKNAAEAEFTTFYDNVIRSQSNFWNLNGSTKTNALSVANTDSAESINDRKAFVYLDLAGTTAETDFKGLVIKCFDHQDAQGWVKGPIGPENTDYVLYDVAYSDFGVAFDGTAFDGLTKTKIDDIIIDSTYTVYTYNSDKVLNYLKDNAGKQVCIAVVDETPTVSLSKPTIWISDPSNKPDQGAPVVVYSDPESSALNTVSSASLSVYPMPVTNGVLNISGANVERAEVYTLVGTMMMSSVVEANQVDLSQVKAGMYLVKLTSDKGDFVKQIIVE